MGFKHKNSGAAGLEPAPIDPAFAAIMDATSAADIGLSALQEWLTKGIKTSDDLVSDFHKRRSEIAETDSLERDHANHAFEAAMFFLSGWKKEI